MKPALKTETAWAVIRNHPPYVLRVFSELDEAEAYAENAQAEYEKHELQISAEVQPVFYCHY